MTEVRFYHLLDQRLERVLPQLLEISLERGWRVVIPEYRRIGSGGGWPATSDDVGAALAAVEEQDDGGGPLVLVGHSAGGHLALVHSGAAAAVVALAPVTDLVRGYAEGIGSGAVSELMGVSPSAGAAAYGLARVMRRRGRRYAPDPPRPAFPRPARPPRGRAPARARASTTWTAARSIRMRRSSSVR